ncbi:unnamed protein product [Nezara viridula]|uniref:Cytochrome b-c1 complex subunit 2, mitochondrial n=1 Tax=Nezara viridula TaxID=85310 RepID=A0A9P0HBH9_NEZVI|nr:unnamed protein product [Nezara viridula]
MASSVSKVPLLQTLAKRTFAAVAAPKAAGSQNKVEVTTLPNKAIVTSLGCGPKPIVQVAVAFRAGSRNETSENYGASHILRSSAGLSTCNASSFYICRSLQQIGASLTATSDRETIVYVLESSASNINEGLDTLRKAVTGQEFRPWELSDNISRIKIELASLPSQAKVIDLIHKAAFRSGLGNSIFVREFNIKKLNSETLQHYAANNLTGDKAAIAGCGISQSDLTCFAESLGLCPGSGSALPASKYSGGEIRIEENIPLQHTIIAAEAPSLDKSDALAYAVLRYALGTGPSVYRGTGSGPLSKVAGVLVGAQALSMAHSDAGLFGIYVASPGYNAKEAVEAAVKVLKGGVTDQDVARGKAQLKAALLYSNERCRGLVDDLVGQALLVTGVPPKSAAELADQVSSVTTQQVQQALQKIQSGKKSLATIGSISKVPYLDEL